MAVVGLFGCVNSEQATEEFDIHSLGEQGLISNAAPADDQTALNGQARVRVWFVGNEQGLEDIGVRSVYLCGNGCTRLGSAKAVQPLDDATGMGSLFADAVVGAETFDRLVVQPDRKSGALIEFKIQRLANPMQLLANGQHEIFLTIHRTENLLQAQFLSANNVPINFTKVMIYRPDRDLNLTLDSGFAATILAGSLPEATIMAAAETDAGTFASSVSLWPRIKTSKPVNFKLPTTPQRLPDGLQTSDYLADLNGQTQPVFFEGNQATFTANEIGDLELFTNREVITTDAGENFAMPEIAPASSTSAISALANTADCKAKLAASKVRYDQLFNTAPFPTALMTSVCKKIAPYVFIVVLNTSDNRGSMNFAISPSLSNPGKYDLKTISEHASSVNASAAVNGFTWQGDQGDGKNQLGEISSTLTTNGQIRSVSTQKEAIIGFGKNTGAGTSASLYLRDNIGDVIDFGTHNHNVVASTTSIIKNGACSASTSGQHNPWSAVGIGKDRAVFVSSANENESDVLELCSVFEGLGYLDGAIRLDGNSAASISFNGKHLNPLGFISSRKYGKARRVAYALAWVRSAPAGETVNIDPSAFDATNSVWDVSGPRYSQEATLAQKGATHTHAFGRAIGKFIYNFNATKKSGSQLEVSARLSSEFPNYSGPADGISDVEVIVNGQSAGVQTVITDNGSGQQYTWRFNQNPLIVGQNSLQFVVASSALHHNGLAIYHRARVATQVDAKIVVTQQP